MPVDFRGLKAANGPLPQPAPQPGSTPQTAKTPDLFPQYRGIGGFFRGISNAAAPRTTGALHAQQDAMIYNSQVNRYNAQQGKQIMQPVNIPDLPSYIYINNR